MGREFIDQESGAIPAVRRNCVILAWGYVLLWFFCDVRVFVLKWMLGCADFP